MTELGWRWTFFLPVPVALVALLAGIRLVPNSGRPLSSRRAFDVPGAVSLTAAMLLLVYTLVEAPDKGWASARTLGSFVLTAVILGLFVLRELRVRPAGTARHPPFATLVRANLAAMTLFGGWVVFQFIATLYMQQLRGWSPIETGLAIFPGGLLVAVLAPRIAFFVMRFGVMKLILAGLVSTAIAYSLFLSIGLDSSYWTAILPTVLLAGLGFALAFAPLNIAATTGVAAVEQGLAGGLLNTSFQFGGALFLAISTAVYNANVGIAGTNQALLDGFHPALVVSVIAAALGVLFTALPLIGASNLRRKSSRPSMPRTRGGMSAPTGTRGRPLWDALASSATARASGRGRARASSARRRPARSCPDEPRDQLVGQRVVEGDGDPVTLVQVVPRLDGRVLGAERLSQGRLTLEAHRQRPRVEGRQREHLPADLEDGGLRAEGELLDRRRPRQAPASQRIGSHVPRG